MKQAKVTFPTKEKDIKRSWHLIDVNRLVLGRIAVKIAKLLIGKSKPYYVQNLDCGDYVVVINCSRIKVTGKKEKQKIYTRYSGYPGGLRKKTFSQVREENPTRILEEAVSGMLPKNKLRASMMKRLFLFSDEKHTYLNKFNK